MAHPADDFAPFFVRSSWPSTIRAGKTCKGCSRPVKGVEFCSTNCRYEYQQKLQTYRDRKNYYKRLEQKVDELERENERLVRLLKEFQNDRD